MPLWGKKKDGKEKKGKKKEGKKREMKGNTSTQKPPENVPRIPVNGNNYFSTTSNREGVNGDYYFSIYTHHSTNTNSLHLNEFFKYATLDGHVYTKEHKRIIYKEGVFTYVIPELRKVKTLADGTGDSEITRNRIVISGNTIEEFVENYNKGYSEINNNNQKLKNEILLKNKIGDFFPTKEELETKLNPTSKGGSRKKKKSKK